MNVFFILHSLEEQLLADASATLDRLEQELNTVPRSTSPASPVPAPGCVGSPGFNLEPDAEERSSQRTGGGKLVGGTNRSKQAPI